MLLDCSELDVSGWSKGRDLCWRTGKLGPGTEALNRARNFGTFTALRTFAHTDPERGIAVKIVPLASVPDARDELPVTRFRLFVKPGSTGEIASEEEKGDVSFGGLTEAVAVENVAEVDGVRGSVRSVVTRVEHVVFVVMCNGFVDDWTWPEVVAVAQKQAAKIRGVLASRS